MVHEDLPLTADDILMHLEISCAVVQQNMEEMLISRKRQPYWLDTGLNLMDASLERVSTFKLSWCLVKQNPKLVPSHWRDLEGNERGWHDYRCFYTAHIHLLQLYLSYVQPLLEYVTPYRIPILHACYACMLCKAGSGEGSIFCSLDVFEALEPQIWVTDWRVWHTNAENCETLPFQSNCAWCSTSDCLTFLFTMKWTRGWRDFRTSHLLVPLSRSMINPHAMSLWISLPMHNSTHANPAVGLQICLGATIH